MQHDMVLPEFLVGSFGAVRKRAKRIVGLAIARGSLCDAVEELGGYTMARELNLPIFEGAASKFVGGKTEGIFLSPLLEEIANATYLNTGLAERDAAYLRAKNLILPATRFSWFNLCSFFTPYWLPVCPLYNREKIIVSRTVLDRVLQQWEDFQSIESSLRTVVGTPMPPYRWTSFAWKLARTLVPEADYPALDSWKQMDSEECGQMIRKIIGEI